MALQREPTFPAGDLLRALLLLVRGHVLREAEVHQAQARLPVQHKVLHLVVDGWILRDVFGLVLLPDGGVVRWRARRLHAVEQILGPGRGSQAFGRAGSKGRKEDGQEKNRRS